MSACSYPACQMLDVTCKCAMVHVSTSHTIWPPSQLATAAVTAFYTARGLAGSSQLAPADAYIRHTSPGCVLRLWQFCKPHCACPYRTVCPACVYVPSMCVLTVELLGLHHRTAWKRAPSRWRAARLTRSGCPGRRGCARVWWAGTTRTRTSRSTPHTWTCAHRCGWLQTVETSSCFGCAGGWQGEGGSGHPWAWLVAWLVA